MSQRDICRQIGQLVIAGFEGHTVPADLKALARTFDLGGVILFARNVAEPGQVADLAAECRSLAREWPLWVSIDQEGGRVARLRQPFTEWPPVSTLGRSGDDRLAERFARALARELLAVGITMDFAPVMDVHTNPRNPVIGDRALGERPEVVARLGRVIIRTMQDEGIAACAKHFPGHGDTSVDSHQALPVIEHPPDRLRAVELQPFRAAIEEQVASIMTAHVLIPALDETRPATLSRRILQSLLRVELGYDGLVVSDDLGMAAISGQHGLAEAAVGAVAAGCDVVLCCGTRADIQAAALEALIHAVESEVLPVAQVEAALRRQRQAKERYLASARPPSSSPDSVVGCQAHQAVARDMERFL